MLLALSVFFVTAGSFRVLLAPNGKGSVLPTALMLSRDGQAAAKHPAGGLAQLKVVSSLAAIFFALEPSLQTKQLILPSLPSTRLAGEMLRQSIIAQLLESAARRDRLGGNTFKILGLSTLTAALIRGMSLILSSGSLSTQGAVVTAVVSLVALMASGPVMLGNGFPRFEFELKNPLSFVFLVFSLYIIIAHLSMISLDARYR